MGLSFSDIFEDRGIKTALARYISVVRGKEKAKFLLLGDKLKGKAEEAERTVQKCDFCEWKCKVNRKEGVLGR